MVCRAPSAPAGGIGGNLGTVDEIESSGFQTDLAKKRLAAKLLVNPF